MENRKYHYEISSTHGNSQKYGNCEVCGKWCSEVFMQSEQTEYMNPIDGETHLTCQGCNANIFGHKDCLISKRR